MQAILIQCAFRLHLWALFLGTWLGGDLSAGARNRNHLNVRSYCTKIPWEWQFQLPSHIVSESDLIQEWHSLGLDHSAQPQRNQWPEVWVSWKDVTMFLMGPWWYCMLDPKPNERHLVQIGEYLSQLSMHIFHITRIARWPRWFPLYVILSWYL